MKTINLPYHPKKYKYIMLRWDGTYTMHTEEEIIKVDNHKYVPEHSHSYDRIKFAEDYVDIDIVVKAFKGSKTNVIRIVNMQEKDTPIARVGSVFILRNDPKRYYALAMKGGVVSIRNLNSSTEWAKVLVPEDNNKITFGELEGILPQNLKMDDLVFLPEPEELLKLLKQ